MATLAKIWERKLTDRDFIEIMLKRCNDELSRPSVLMVDDARAFAYGEMRALINSYLESNHG